MVRGTAKKRNSIIRIIFLLIAAAALVPFMTSLNAKERVVSYFPRNETMENVRKTYTNKVLGEVTCDAAEELFARASDCMYCVNELKTNCPDCCIATAPNRAVRCTPEEDERYDCLPDPFFSCSETDGCSVTQSSCLKEGCPETEPDVDGECIYYDGSWVCKGDEVRKTYYQKHTTPLPVFGGCPVTNEAVATGLISRPSFPYYYPCRGKVTFPADGWEEKWYTFEPTDEYKDVIKQCKKYMEEKASCESGVQQCFALDCSGTALTLGDCDKSEDGACTKRIAWPECDDYTAERCTELYKEATECLSNASGKCHECFREIDETFSYQFVAKSRESVVLFWQVLADTSAAADPYKYFYTMLKVFDSSTGEAVHESLVHQKSFQGAFSIFSATSVSSAGLEQGHAYTVRLYYFIAPDDEERLTAEISNVQIIALRARE